MLPKEGGSLKVKVVLGTLAVLYTLAAVVYSFQFFGQKETVPKQSTQTEEQDILTGTLGEVEQANAAMLTLKIGQMCCINEANTVAGVLKDLGAIGEVKVDLRQRHFSMVYDKKKIDQSGIITAIKNAGFSSEVVKE